MCMFVITGASPVTVVVTGGVVPDDTTYVSPLVLVIVCILGILLVICLHIFVITVFCATRKRRRQRTGSYK